MAKKLNSLVYVWLFASTLTGGVAHARDYNPVLAKKRAIGSKIVNLLRADGEFDRVESFLFGGTDLLVTGYYHDKYGDWDEWAINLDDLCRTILEEKRVLYFIDVSDRICVETSTADYFCSPSLGHDTAEQLLGIINSYVGDKGGKCDYWIKYNQQHQTPTGPVKSR